MTQSKIIFANRLRRSRSSLKKNNKRNLPRLSVFRSNQHIYAQIIDDTLGQTLVAANTMQKDFAALKDTSNIAAAKEVAGKLAKLALEKGIKAVIFDKGAYKYHGQVKCIAETVRECGMVV